MEKKHKGLFITFEGGEGVGKTTLIDRVFGELIQKGFAVMQTRAPGGTELGKHIRELLLHRDDFHLLKTPELFLFLADRAQHVEEMILPELESNKIVLCDRFNDSTMAYQGAARAFNKDDLRHFCSLATSHLVPDLTLFLDLDPVIGLERAKQKKGSSHDRIEQEEISFHTKVRQAYLDFATEEPDRFHIVDASLPSNEVFKQAMDEINLKLSSSLCLS